MIFAFVLVDKRCVALFFERRLAFTFLERRGTILQVNEVLEFGLLAAEVHERD